MECDVDFCRVYYNKSGNPKKAWSVDLGEGTVELIAEFVAFEAIHAVFETDIAISFT